MKKYLLILSIVAVLAFGGSFAYTYLTSIGTIGILPPTGEWATCNTAASQPDWNSVLTPSSTTSTEILRPNAAGNETGIQSQSPGTGAHWDKVDEAVADGDSTVVYTSNSSWEEDLYNIPNHSASSGNVTYVKVNIECRSDATPTQTNVYVHIKTHDTEYNGTEETTGTSYSTFSYQWDDNPNTGEDWTWDEVDALQIGVGLRQPTAGQLTGCTQVYAEIGYGSIDICGDVPTGELFTILPHPAYTGDLQVGVYLTNTGDLIKAYQYLNMELYMVGSSSANQTPNYRLLTLQNGQQTLSLENLVAISGEFEQTTQSDFESSNLTNLDTITSPGDVFLDNFADNVTDNFTDESKIAYKNNLVVSNSQVKLVAGGSSGTETFRPNAAGDDTNISSQYPASGAHWEKVDEVTADNYTTYVSTNSTSYQRDLYSIPDHSTGSGAVDNVTAYFRFANSATTKWGIVYRGPSDDGFLKTAEITTNAQVSDNIIDTLEWDTVNGQQPDIIKVSGDVYAIPYNGTDSDGWLATVEVDTSGNITDTLIDTMEWDIANGFEPEIVHVSGDVYAIAYRGTGADGWLCTVGINSSGNITNTVTDTLEWDTANGYEPEIIHVSGDVYAIAYRGTDADGWLCTVGINSSGNITNTVTDTMEWDIANGYTPDIIHVSGDVYAIAYRGTGADGWLCTVGINSSGNITNNVTDTLEWDIANGYEPDIIHISGDVYAIAYRGTGDDGWLATVEIDSSGNITNTVIDTFEWDTSDGWEPNIAHVAGNFYAIAYRRGISNLGYLTTVEIATDGQITNSIIDTLQFETTYGFTPKLILVSGTPGNVYARAAAKTHGTVYTGSEESNATDTFVLKSYPWTTNPNTGQAWTWSEIDALQVGIELKADSIDDGAVCTQVYLVVNYTAYSSPGTLTSINLLSAKTAYTIDTFYYDAPAIPSGTGLKVQYSTDNTTWYNSSGTPGSWDTMSQGTDNISLSGLSWSGSNFYYNMEFTSDGSDTPVLDMIAVIFSTYYSSGNLTSSKHDAGPDVTWNWDFIYFTINEPTNTDVKFQMRTAATEAGLDSATWYGPTGTDDYYTTSGTEVNSVHDGDRWVQYKAYFSGPGTTTPELSDITITYIAAAVTYTVEIIGGSHCLVSDNTSEWGAGWTVTPEFYCEATQR